VAVGIGVMAIVGCGARTVDPSDVEAKIAAKITEQQPTMAPVSVRCPAEQRVGAGTTFQCTVQGSGGVSGTVDVTETDDSGTLSIRYPAPPGTAPPATAPSGLSGGGTVTVAPPDDATGTTGTTDTQLGGEGLGGG
jgi:hypothetical protein